MNSKRIIFLGAFLFTLSLLPAQRLQQGLSIGLPVFGHLMPLEIYYNNLSSYESLFDDVFQASPTYGLTYAFAAKGRKQWFVKQMGMVEPYRRTANPWDYPEYFIRLGAGRTHYLPFAPALQWQWEVGVQAERIWKRLDYTDYNPNAYTKWNRPLPYGSINLQTTALGKHLILGMGLEVAFNERYDHFTEEARLVANVAWAIKAREQDPVFERPTLDDRSKKIHIGYQRARYGEWDEYGEDYLVEMGSILGEYWWGFQKHWRFASRLGFGLSTTGKSANLGIGYDWLIHVEQNAYLRLAEHCSILPFGGVGIFTGQILPDRYRPNRWPQIRKSIFRPYLKGGFRIQAPHHRIFAEFSVSTLPSFQMGLGVRLGR